VCGDITRVVVHSHREVVKLTIPAGGLPPVCHVKTSSPNTHHPFHTVTHQSSVFIFSFMYFISFSYLSFSSLISFALGFVVIAGCLVHPISWNNISIIAILFIVLFPV